MKTLLSAIALVVLFAQCTPRYAYSPSAHNVPVFAQKGDSKLAAYYSTNGPSASSDDNNNQYDKKTAQGTDLQAAYAVTNNIAVQANYYYRGEKSKESVSSSNNYSSSSIKYRRNLVEFGAGYFTPIDKKKKILVQVYAGAGLGKTTIDDHGIDQNQIPYSRYYNANFNKFFIEPSMTFRNKEIFAATIATRASLIKFHNVNSDYTQAEKMDFNLDSLDRFAVGFFEPSFIGSFGFEKLPGLRVEFQVGLSVLWEEDFIDYRPFNFSAGLVFDLPKLFNKTSAARKD